MLKIVKYLYHNTTAGNFIINQIFKIHNAYRIYCIPEIRFLKSNYKAHFGVYPDLKNPKTLNEKIVWLKLNDRTPLHTQCADKIAVRSYVEQKIGAEYLIPLLFSSDNIDDLTPENFPKTEPFILKTNHDSSGGIIIKNPQEADWKTIKKKIKKHLKVNYYYPSKEWQYKNINPRFLAEKLLVNKAGTIPFDYKFHCFNGKVEVIQVDIDRFTDHKRNLYDVHWNLLPFTWSLWKDNQPLWPNGNAVDKPLLLSKMIELSEKLAASFVYVRIDLYDLDGEIYFGEITFHHGSGHERIFPEEFGLELGAKVDLTLIS